MGIMLLVCQTTFKSTNIHQQVEWRWTVGLLLLTNQIGCYESMLREEIRVEFKKEVESWIDKGILIPWSGKVEGILLLMAVVQPTKKKVRPVLDF